MQAFQSVRERKMNKAHREVVNDENKNTLNEQKVSVDKKKIIRENIAERKRKRISAQNEIVIPNLEEKYKIPTTPSQQIKKTINESEETTPTTLKPKKYYDQDEIRKYIKEKRISRRKSQEELDQVVPEKPKTKSYDVNEVRDFMRKRLKAREEQHKKEMLDKERKSNEIKERLQKLREFQRNQRNSNNDKNKIKTKVQTDASPSAEKSNKEIGINIQTNNYLKPTTNNSNKNKVVVINKFSNPVHNDSNLSISNTHTSSNIYDNDTNHTFSSFDNSEYENIPTKLTNDSYDELSEITNSITKDNDLESTSNYNEDYSIESLQSQAKRIQELIKNAEVLAQRIEQHTSKMPKPKDNVNKLTININTNPIDKINSHPTISTDFISHRDNDSSSSSSSNYPISSPYPMTSPYPSSSHSDVTSIPYAFLTSHSNNETPIPDQISVMKNSKGKNELLSENNIPSIEKVKPSIEKVNVNKTVSPTSQKSPSKNKLKEKDPYYEMENENSSYDQDQTPIHDESFEKSLSLNDISLSSDSEIKLENVENITPHQWRLQINPPPAKKGDNYSTINIFTRRFHPSKKEEMKRKSDANNIYKKIVKKMEEENKEEKLSLDSKTNKESINATTEQNNTVEGITEKQTYIESDHSSNPIESESRLDYSDDFTNLSNYHSLDDSSSQSHAYSDYTSIPSSDYSSQNIQPPTPPSTSYQQNHCHCPPPQPQFYPPQPQIHPIPPMSAPTYENKEEGRLSPHSLSRKLMSEINYLETLNESNLRLAEMENERNTVRAEQEMATVLHALILKQKKHEMDIENAIKFREDKLRTIGVQALPETNEKGVLAEEEPIKKDDPNLKLFLQVLKVTFMMILFKYYQNIPCPWKTPYPLYLVNMIKSQKKTIN